MGERGGELTCQVRFHLGKPVKYFCINALNLVSELGKKRSSLLSAQYNSLKLNIPISPRQSLGI